MARDTTLWLWTGHFTRRIISEGSVDLARKTKRWDDKQVSRLKSRKEKLSEDLRPGRMMDRIFSDLCKKIGVKNIRQSQLEFKQKREDQLQQNVRKFERIVQDVEDQLEANKKNEEGIMQKIDKEMGKIQQTHDPEVVQDGLH